MAKVLPNWEADLEIMREVQKSDLRNDVFVPEEGKKDRSAQLFEDGYLIRGYKLTNKGREALAKRK